jgi:hypothetical protein
MTSKQMLERWLDFWFKPQSPTPVALFRIVFGFLVLQSIFVHIGPNVLDWYGPHAVTNFENIKRFWWLNQPRFDLFLLFPNTDQGVLTLWWIYAVAAVCLTIGFCTRAASLAVCLILISTHNHQPFNINGGDAMMRLMAGMLVFADAGGAFSVDRLIMRLLFPTFGDDSKPKPSAPTGQRLIQVQMAIAYGSTFFHKISGAQWLDGTAVYYAVRLDDMTRHPMPLLYDNLLFCKLLTWYTLLVEGAMFTLVWLRDVRYYVLAATALMHLGIDYSINLPVFEWMFMAGFIAFIEPEDLTKLMTWLKRRVEIGFGSPEPLTYNAESKQQTSLASLIEGLDVFGRLTIEPASSAASYLSAESRWGGLRGFNLFAWLTCRLPILWPLFPLFGLPFLLFHQKRETAKEIAPTKAIENSETQLRETTPTTSNADAKTD